MEHSQGPSDISHEGNADADTGSDSGSHKEAVDANVHKSSNVEHASKGRKSKVAAGEAGGLAAAGSMQKKKKRKKTDVVTGLPALSGSRKRGLNGKGNAKTAVAE